MVLMYCPNCKRYVIAYTNIVWTCSECNIVLYNKDMHKKDV